MKCRRDSIAVDLALALNTLVEGLTNVASLRS